MNIVIVGGTGLIGSRLVTRLRDHGHRATAAAPSTGVDTVTGEGLARALVGADVVVDVSNSPSFDDSAVLAFFATSTANLLAAETTAGVRHHVALSVVGTPRLLESGYFRAKMAQEQLIGESSRPYTIVRATQFYEFVTRIGDQATVGDTVRLAPVLFQPMAADDVARAVGRAAVEPPVNGVIETAGPARFRLDQLIRDRWRARQDPRQVITDPDARYFGARLGERTLLPGDGAQLGSVTLEEWSSQAPRR